MFNERIWKEGEKLTYQYMKNRGYKMLYTNFSCVGVELDIVAVLTISHQKKILEKELGELIKDETDKEKVNTLKKTYAGYYKNLKDILIITEVKSRNTEKYGKGKESIPILKKIHMKRGAEFLMRKKEFQNMQVRYDIASVTGDEIEYIENAFE